MALNKARVRALHRWFAPVMAMPLLLTLTTGMAFQMAATAGKGSDFICRTYAAKITGATDSVGIPPAPLDKGGGDSRGDLATRRSLFPCVSPDLVTPIP